MTRTLPGPAPTTCAKTRCSAPAAVRFTLTDPDPAKSFTRRFCGKHAAADAVALSRPGRRITIAATPATFPDGEQCPDWCTDHQDVGPLDPEVHHGAVLVELGARMSVLDGADQLSIGIHVGPDRDRTIDVCAVAPWGDVLGSMSPDTARRVAAGLVEAADLLDAHEVEAATR